MMQNIFPEFRSTTYTPIYGWNMLFIKMMQIRKIYIHNKDIRPKLINTIHHDISICRFLSFTLKKKCANLIRYNAKTWQIKTNVL